jgi:hypothetical protein
MILAGDVGGTHTRPALFESLSPFLGVGLELRGP